jgi:hypothetical protein
VDLALTIERIGGSLVVRLPQAEINRESLKGLELWSNLSATIGSGSLASTDCPDCPGSPDSTQEVADCPPVYSTGQGLQQPRRGP